MHSMYNPVNLTISLNRHMDSTAIRMLRTRLRMQVYGHCQPDQNEGLSIRISNCVDAISDWMFRSHLQLNASKTEVMWCSSSRLRLNSLPNRSSSAPTWSSQLLSVRNLGIWIDSQCSRTTHINKTTRSCCTSLREIRSIDAPHSFDVRKLLIFIFCPIKDWLRQFNSGRLIFKPPRATSTQLRKSYTKKESTTTLSLSTISTG